MQTFYEDIFNAYDLDILSKYTLVFNDSISGVLKNDLELLNEINNKTDKKLLLMYDHDPQWQAEEYFLTLYKHNKNVYLSSADFNNYFSSHPNIVYFPTFYFTQLVHTNYQTIPKKYRFSFLSNKPKFHRIYFYYIVKNNINTSTDCFSVNNEAFGRKWYKERYIQEMTKTLGFYNPVMEQTLPYITSNAEKCNQELNTINDHSSDISNKHIAYNSYFNIVGESDNDPNKVFITEKTWKAIRSKVVPVFLNSDYMFNAMSTLGFTVVNEINISGVNFVDKVSHINKYMKDCTIDDISKLYAKQYTNVNNNFEHFYSSALKNIFVTYIRDKLKI